MRRRVLRPEFHVEVTSNGRATWPKRPQAMEITKEKQKSPGPLNPSEGRFLPCLTTFLARRRDPLPTGPSLAP